MTFENPTVGEELPAIEVRVTRETAVRYAGASGDFNPIHWSDRQAAALGLPGVIVHGMWTMGAALRVVTDWCGDPGRVRTYAVRFTRPVVIPDDDDGVLVRFGGKVSTVTDDTVTVTLEAMCGDDKVLGNAKVEVAR